MLCVGVNILCKHVQMCVCVLWHVRGHDNRTDNTRFGIATNHREIMRFNWSSMSIGFIILIKIFMKTGSGTKDGFRDLVMHGEGVRHSTIFVCRRLPASTCSCLCLINQAKMLD